MDHSVYAGATDVPYSYGVLGNEWAWPDGLSALQSHCIEDHAEEADQPAAKREARRLLRSVLRFVLGLK